MLKDELISQIAEGAGVHGSDVARIMEYLIDTQIVTYTFPDPEGNNFHYSDLDDVAMELDLLDTGGGQQWPIHMQIEMRDPVHHIQFVKEQPVLLK